MRKSVFNTPKIWQLFIDNYKSFKRGEDFDTSEIQNTPYTGEIFYMFNRFGDVQYFCMIHKNGLCSVYTYNNICILSTVYEDYSAKLADLLENNI